VRGGGSGGAGLFVVVPYYNEERWLPATLAALAAQSDPSFQLVLVDNASTDGSAAVARAAERAHPLLSVHHVAEPVKGTGAASDTGFRYAIALGARWIARTDADCVPDRDWVRHLRRALRDGGLEFVAGRMRPRGDEGRSWADRVALPVMIRLAEVYVRLARRGPQYRYPCFLVPGNNLAITADLYLRSGGFPRTRLEETHEDRALAERVRTLTARAAWCREAVVYNSARRVKAYGYLNTLRWYRNHGYRPAQVDVR
jgi:glycosyltransferase involved in cell wall biosynthesis